MSPETQPHRTIILQLLEQNTPVSFLAGGPSMTPTIRSGESVSIRPVEPGDFRPGAILLYRKNERLVLHRLIHRRGPAGKLIFCGDAALRGSEAVELDRIIGTATSVQRGTRSIPLNTPRRRLLGSLRYSLRPLRRWVVGWIHPDHEPTSAP